MIHREAVGNHRRVGVLQGSLEHLYPDIRIRADGDRATFTLSGGLGFVPITFTGLSSSRSYTLRVDGEPVDQNVHGNDFWQTDYDPVKRRWSRSYNVPITDDKAHTIKLIPKN